MSITTIKAGARFYRLTPDTANLAGFPFIELGAAGTSSSVGVMTVQFQPAMNFDGSFTVVGKVWGPAADAVNTPFVPIPYRRISVANTAQLYEMVTDPITTSAVIQIPANGLSVALVASPPTQGYCDIVSWDLQGASSI